LFAAAILLLHFLSPEFSPTSQGISYYALGKFGWLFTLSLVFVGVASLAMVGLCWKDAPTTSGRIGLSLVVLWILLMEAGAFFEMDPLGHTPTFSGRVHSIAGISFLLLYYPLQSRYKRVTPLVTNAVIVFPEPKLGRHDVWRCFATQRSHVSLSGRD
jgi:hypothetical protein